MSNKSLVERYVELAQNIRGEEHLEIIEEILGLNRHDNLKFREIAMELLEPTIRLQISLYEKENKSLGTLSECLGNESDPRELLIELKAIICYLTTDNHDLNTLIQTIPNQSIVKTTLTQYVHSILKNLKTKDLHWGLMDLEVYLDYIAKDTEKSSRFVDSDYFQEQLQVFVTRKQDFQASYSQTLKYLLALLAIPKNTLAISRTIAKTLGDFYTIFSSVKDYIPGIPILAYHASVCEIPSLPLVLSGISRLQMFLPLSTYISTTHPTLFISLFEHSITYIDRPFKNRSEPINKLQSLTVLKFYSTLIDFIGSNSEKRLTEKAFFLFKSLIDNNRPGSRCQLLSFLIRNYSWDKAKSMLIDLYTQTVSSNPYAFPESLLRYIFTLTPIQDYSSTYYSGFNLLRILSILSPASVDSLYNSLILPLTQEICSFSDQTLLQWALEELKVTLNK